MNNYSGYGNPLAVRSKPDYLHPLLIAFTGKLGSGKSTAADYVLSKYGGVKIPFARGVKLEVYDALASTKSATNVTIAVPNGDLLNKSGEVFENMPVPKLVLPSPNDKVKWIDKNKAALRPLLQHWGTNYRRAQDPRYWIDQAVKAIEEARSNSVEVIVVDDLRFRNEADALGDIGFRIAKLTVGDDERVSRVFSRDAVSVSPDDTHSSETELDSLATDFIIENSTEPHIMKQQIDAMIIDILNPAV